MWLTAWRNNARKTNPWGRTKSEQKVWNRRPTADGYRGWDEEDERNNRIQVEDDGMKTISQNKQYQYKLQITI